MTRKRSLYLVSALLLLGLVIYLVVPNPSRYLWLLGFVALHFGMHSLHGHGGGHCHGNLHSPSAKSQASGAPEQQAQGRVPDSPIPETK